MIALQGDGRLGEAGRIRTGVWAPSPLVCRLWKYSDLRANTLSFPRAGDPETLLCSRRQPSQEPGTWHHGVLGCPPAARHGSALHRALLRGPTEPRGLLGSHCWACSIACRVRVGDALLATPLSPSPLPQAQKLLGAAEPAWHVEWLVQSVPTGGQSPPSFFCDTDTKQGECQRGSKGSEARPNGHFSSWPLGGARAHWSKACLLVPH